MSYRNKSQHFHPLVNPNKNHGIFPAILGQHVYTPENPNSWNLKKNIGKGKNMNPKHQLSRSMLNFGGVILQSFELLAAKLLAAAMRVSPKIVFCPKAQESFQSSTCLCLFSKASNHWNLFATCLSMKISAQAMLEVVVFKPC